MIVIIIIVINERLILKLILLFKNKLDIIFLTYNSWPVNELIGFWLNKLSNNISISIGGIVVVFILVLNIGIIVILFLNFNFISKVAEILF